jgi:protein-tyrosine phosphatase
MPARGRVWKRAESVVDYSQITDSLFIGRTPHSEDYDELRSLDVQLVINMRLEQRPHKDTHNPPMPVVRIPTIDSPLFPIPIRGLMKGVKAALAVIASGGKVYVHCQAGVHRGVAMGAAVLIAQGYELEEAMKLIKQRRPAADPDAWYIRRKIMRFAETWKQKRHN